MSPTTSGLYTGTVMHRRVKPHVHRLKYSVFSLLLDLDEIDRLAGKLRLFSKNRLNLFSFYEKDFGDKTGVSLRTQVERDLLEAGIDLEGGAIKLFAMPRFLGYGFNPLSVYFCYQPDGLLRAIIYEVHNTFSERHSYLIPVDENEQESIHQQCAKRLYVSPFMDMDMTYSFRITPPSEQVAIAIQARDRAGPVMTAVLSAARNELTDAALLRAAIIYPLLTLKVIAGIHFEALVLWLKGMRLRERPSPPAKPVTIVATHRTSDKMHKDVPIHVLR